MSASLAKRSTIAADAAATKALLIRNSDAAPTLDGALTDAAWSEVGCADSASYRCLMGA
ncbi:MAG: hypothetical protein AAGM38_17210 [Pseudomonadota bacterium]